ncbi:hypothetical protein ILUMI_02986 [Ignelater luminosus]|uniref:Uncharacterized protein n=1 Tax=Ignelater luminosus TaxID=2038154 RepID=A0A8K0DBN0_IGNLU|nr:hypothetical protein ILUMI_02986 [Ignelater luminosus]
MSSLRLYKIEFMSTTSRKEIKYVFWPDLASSHYAKILTDSLRNKNIKFIQKEDNPANCLEARPIEDFWSLLKGSWRAANVDQLVSRIKYCLGKIDQDVKRRLAESTKKRIDVIRRKGLIQLRIISSRARYQRGVQKNVQEESSKPLVEEDSDKDINGGHFIFHKIGLSTDLKSIFDLQ